MFNFIDFKFLNKNIKNKLLILKKSNYLYFFEKK